MENLNISEVLFYAPKGLMLYSPIFGEVEFIEIDEDNCIVVRDKHDNLRWFYEYGTYFPSDESNYAEGECLLFPSIDNRCWDNWQNILFPKSIGSVCFDTITGNKFILDHNGTFFSDGTGSLFLKLIENSGNYLLNSAYASPSQTKEFFEELEKSDYEWVSDTVVRKKQNRPKFKVGDWVVNNNSGDVFQVTEIKDDEYCLWPLYCEICGYLRIIDVDTDYHLWTIEDAKDGDMLAAPPIKGSENNVQIFIFKGINNRDYVDNCIEYYCRVCNGMFYENKTGFMGTTSSTFYPATKGQRDFLFQKMKEEEYQWNADTKKLIKTTTPIPKFKFGDIIKHKNTGAINSIKYVCSDYYVLDNNQALFFESQDMWELAASKANPSLEDKVSILADEIIALKERVKALELQEIKQCSDKNRLDSLESKMIILDSHNVNERLDALESKVNALGLQAIRTTPLLTSASDGIEEDNVTLEEENESK